MHIENTLKGKLKSQHKTNKAILRTPNQKFENPIFLFRITYEAEIRNSKMLAAFKGDLCAAIVAQKDSPLNYGSEFHNTSALAKSFL